MLSVDARPVVWSLVSKSFLKFYVHLHSHLRYNSKFMKMAWKGDKSTVELVENFKWEERERGEGRCHWTLEAVDVSWERYEKE